MFKAIPRTTRFLKPEKSLNPKPMSYWLSHKAETENLLPLSVSNFTLNNFEKIMSVINMGSNSHNLYDNLGDTDNKIKYKERRTFL